MAQQSRLGAFMRLWLVMLFSYTTIKFVLNLFTLRAIDLRLNFFVELLVLPLGQSVIFWLVTRRVRATPQNAAPDDGAARTA